MSTRRKDTTHVWNRDGGESVIVLTKAETKDMLKDMSLYMVDYGWV